MSYLEGDLKSVFVTDYRGKLPEPVITPCLLNLFMLKLSPVDFINLNLL